MAITQNYNDKIERFKVEFESDPLYQKLIQMGLEDKLFEPCVLYERVFFDATYSTKQAAELLEKSGSQQTLINFLNRNDFDSYIQINRQGDRGFYRYDYRTLFQFKMIFLLTELGQSPLDIASLIGLKSEYENPVARRLVRKGTSTNEITPAQDSAQIKQLAETLQQEYKDKMSQILQYVQQSSKEQREINQRMILEQKEKDLNKEIELWQVATENLVARIEDMEFAIGVQKASHLFNTSKKDERTFLGIKLKTKEVDSEEQKKLQSMVEEKIKAIEERKAALLQEKEERDKQKEVLYKQLKEIRQERNAFEQKHLESTSPDKLETNSKTDGDHDDDK